MIRVIDNSDVLLAMGRRDAADLRTLLEADCKRLQAELDAGSARYCWRCYEIARLIADALYCAEIDLADHS